MVQTGGFQSVVRESAASASPGSLLEMQILGSCARPTESEAQGVGLSHLKFKKLSAPSEWRLS